MSRPVEEGLQEIIRQHGRSVCNDPPRLRAMLRDRCPAAAKGDLHVLMSALGEGICQDLATTQTNAPDELLLARLAARLQDNLHLTEKAARWAVETWAVSLGLPVPLPPAEPPATVRQADAGFGQTIVSPQDAPSSPANLPREFTPPPRTSPPPAVHPPQSSSRVMSLLGMVFGLLALVVSLGIAVMSFWPKPPTGEANADPHAPPAARPGDVFTNSIGMTLVLVPAGEFEMGTSESVGDLRRTFTDAKPTNFDDERPAHHVRITRPFYLGQYEVTLGQFLKFVQATGYQCECQRDGKGGWGYSTDGEYVQNPEFAPWIWGHAGQTPDHPVVNVTWNDAAEFCRWLSQQEKRAYWLPSEAEWEYACRAGTTTRYYNGDDPEGLTQVGNVADATARARFPDWIITSSSDGYELTAPVGRFKPNAFGLYDMHGNVWEWCADWYAKDYYAASPENDPAGPSNGPDRVDRGGGWDGRPRGCRSAARFRNPPSNRDNNLGFRVACSPR